MQNKHECYSINQLRGVGKQIAKYLARLHIYSIQDLLFHLPYRYQDRTQRQTIRSLTPGNEALIEGIISEIFFPKRGRTKFLCELKDETAKINLRFFHIRSFQIEMLKPGIRLRCFGEVRLGVKGLEMFHPEFQVINMENPPPEEQHLTPFYYATEGLSQSIVRKLTLTAMTLLDSPNFLRELIPASFLQLFSLPTMKDALQFIHRPPRDNALVTLAAYETAAQKRLVFEELLAHRIQLLQVKRLFQSQRAMALISNGELRQKFLNGLPFQLTNAQTRVFAEINQDLEKPNPMLRLVQGDVGSGKTVIAALAMLQSIESGYQAVMMAPTELLAEQHYRVLKQWFEPLDVKISLLTGRIKANNRKVLLQNIHEGHSQIIVGTHALFQEEVSFAKLALVIIDEQHRFGVHQRALLRRKGEYEKLYPHQLIMTATPIPRTLAMSFYSDLDCSTIDELPPGRTPIVTSVMPNSKRDEVITRIKVACEQGRQAYWVCPLIDESENISCQAVLSIAEQLQKLLPLLTMGILHGRMNIAEKDEVMNKFKNGEIHLLVATTVIEVGVDVSNASVMIIENAERMGLAQLHQLRGRVGRGKIASHCVLLYQSPLTSIAKERLQVMRETTDGFQIAQKDLELRGPGEVLGTRQTGELLFRVADLIRDKELIPQVQEAAPIFMQQCSENIESLMNRWLGDHKVYQQV